MLRTVLGYARTIPGKQAVNAGNPTALVWNMPDKQNEAGATP